MNKKIKFKIERLIKSTAYDLRGINILLPQQADKPRLLNMAELKRVLDQKCIRMYVARTQIRGKTTIVGMGSVILYWVPTGLIAFIEELTVDEHFRGHKLGFRIVERLIKDAKESKAKHISTYTNPKRLAANAIYKKLGFFKKETNFYRINIHLPKPTAKKAINNILKYQKKYGHLL